MGGFYKIASPIFLIGRLPSPSIKIYYKKEKIFDLADRLCTVKLNLQLFHYPICLNNENIVISLANNEIKKPFKYRLNKVTYHLFGVAVVLASVAIASYLALCIISLLAERRVTI